MTVKLRPINRGPRDNRYCGPAVVSFVTGQNTSDVSRYIRNKFRNGRPIRGTYDHEVKHAFRALGFDLNRAPVRVNNKLPTLAGWLKAYKDMRTAGRVFLISAGHHWQLISGRKYACGRIGEIVSIRDKRVKRRCRVRNVWEISKFDIKDSDWQNYGVQTSMPKTNYSYLIKKMLRQYPQFGFDYEVEWRDPDTRVAQYYVSMSHELEDLAEQLDDCLKDEHYCYGLEEVYSRMQEMLVFAKENT